jgi:drug/metabolite transporter (DMT)-like permease
MTGRPGAPAGPPAPPLAIAGALALLCLIWGTTWKVIQIGLRGIPPFTGVSARFLLAGVLLWALARARGVVLGRSARERALWVVNGVLSFGVSYGVVYWSEQWVPSGLAAILFATYPLLVAVLAHFVLPAEALTRRDVVGVLLGFGGVGLIYSEDLSLLGGPQVALAAAVMLASPVASAASSVAIKRWGAGVHPWSLSSVPMILAGVALGGVALAAESDRTVALDPVSVTALLYLAIFGSAVTFSVYYWLLARLPVKRLALIAYVIPIVAVILGTLSGEPLTWRILLGAALVIGGVAIAVQR